MSRFLKTLILLFVFFVVFWLIFACADDTQAQGLNDEGTTLRACTVKDNWFTKIFNPCVELADNPTVIDLSKLDVTKWAQALEKAENYLREHSNGNNDPVDNDNTVSNLAWKYYCNGLDNDTPKFDMQGNPICQ